MTIGNIDLNRVEELRIPNKIAYFTADEALIAANRHWLEPHFLDAEGGFDLVFQSWLFEADGTVVLVDPCTGNGRPHPVPFFDNLNVPFIERLSETGYRPEDVDIVVCTHLHHDHCGWNTQLRGGKWVPTFPNARYIMQQVEFDRWGKDACRHPRFDYNEDVFERSVRPVFESGLADLVNGHHRIGPGLTVELAPGHTIGHQMLHLVSSGQHALFTGDCFHHPIQLVEPSILFGDTEDTHALLHTRQRLIELAADLKAVLIAAHLPMPYGVRVQRQGDQLCFRGA